MPYPHPHMGQERSRHLSRLIRKGNIVPHLTNNLQFTQACTLCQDTTEENETLNLDSITSECGGRPSKHSTNCNQE